MTHEMVNSLVKDPPSTSASIQELVVQGIANFFTGMFGGLGGSALVGETVINVLHGARGRVSCVVAGLTMLAIMESLGPVVRVRGSVDGWMWVDGWGGLCCVFCYTAWQWQPSTHSTTTTTATTTTPDPH
jgi:hypothetical protein